MSRCIRGAAALVICMSSVTLACTTTTGTRRVATSNELAQAKSIGVFVTSDQPFSVREAREKLTNTGVALGGLLGAAIESGMRSSQDSKQTESLQGAVGEFDSSRELAGRVASSLRTVSEPRKADVVTDSNTEALRQEGFDSLLSIIVKEWGLRLCPGSGSQVVQAAFALEARLVVLELGAPIWQRTDLYVDRECRTVEAFQDAELLTASLQRAADGAAKRIVNDIVFP